MSRDGDDNVNVHVPFYLMPVAAVLGMYAMAGTLRLLYLLHAKLFTKKQVIPVPTVSTYTFLILSTMLSILAYARIVASVNNAMEAWSHAHFRPYELLSIPETANITEIEQAYHRSLSELLHHPDKQKGGSEEDAFQNIHLAYQALTDKIGMLNYQQYGHPEGPPSSSAMAFALPSWLLHPQGSAAIVLILLYLGMFVGIALVAIRIVVTRGVVNEQTPPDEPNGLSGGDAEYLTSFLTPTTSSMDILYMICTTPRNIAIAETSLDHVEMLKRKRLEHLVVTEEKKKSDFDLGDGWADDEDDDEEDDQVKEAVAKAKELEETKKKEREQLNATQGKPTTVLLEGIDDGVIGQEWVERTLQQEGVWPLTDLGWLTDKTFDYKGKTQVVKAMEHAAIRRNLCFTTGRLQSQLLNNHVDLLEAGSKGLVDQTYFKATVEYRQRTALLLEAALKFATTTLNSYQLSKTIIETMTMFKLGAPSATRVEQIQWFEDVMKKTLGVVPRLEISNLDIHAVDEKNDDEIIATNDTCTAEMNVTRPHAENFTKQKIIQCQKQGIPPQIGLQSYREGWWILIRAEPRKDNEKEIDPHKVPTTTTTSSSMVESFQQDHLLTAWPMVVQNVAQKSGKIKLKFKAPAIPGKYRFHVQVKSQEFLGADVELTCERDILDEEVVTKKRVTAAQDHDEEEDKEEEDNNNRNNNDDEEEEEDKKEK